MQPSFTKHSRSFFGTFFPVPKSLSLVGPGIEISEDMIRVVTGGGHAGKGKIVYREKPLLPGIVSGGEVVDANALTEAIRSLEISPSPIRLAIPDEKVFLFDVSIPQKDIANPDDAILFRLEENVPIPVEEALFEWRVVGSKETPEGTIIHFSVTVLPQNSLRPFVDAAEAAGHMVVEVVPKTLSIAHAVGFGDLRPWLLLYVGRSKSSIAVVTGRIVRYSSVVPTGMTQIVTELSKLIKKPLAETESLFVAQGTVAFENKDDALFNLSHSFLALRDEVSKVVSFWNNQNARTDDQARIEKVLVTGVHVSAPGVLDLIASGGPVSYTLANPWNHLLSEMSDVPGLSREESLRAAACLGLLSSR